MKMPVERAVRVGGLLWKVIETRGKKGAPTLVMLPGTLGTAAIFKEPMERLGTRVRMLSLTYPLIDDIGRLADSLAALMDQLGLLMDIKATQGLPGLGMLLGKVCANRAFKVYPNSRTTTHQGKHIKLVHRCHVEDRNNKTVLCLHFAQDPHSEKLIIGWAEEIPLAA